MHPEINHAKLKELQSNEESQQLLWKSFTGVVTKFRNRFISSDKSELKHFPIVKTYLAQYCKFITGESSLTLNAVEVVHEIVYIIVSLMNSYFYVNHGYHSLFHSDVKLVSKLPGGRICVYLPDLVVNYLYLPVRGWVKEVAREISFSYQPVDNYNISLSRNLKVYVFDVAITHV